MMPAPEDVTLGEVARSLTALRGDMSDLRTEMRGRFDGLSFVSKDVYDRDIADLKDDVRELKDAKQWMGRTLVAAFLFPTLVAIVVALVVTR